MSDAEIIACNWHPLAAGRPPDWASGWGQDRRGVFAEFSVDRVVARLRWIRPGRFLMGSPPDEAGYRSLCDEVDWYRGREEPQTEITFRDGFWLMDAPVTQALYEAVTGENPSRFVTPDRPVEQVSFDDAVSFIDMINSRIPGLDLRLPSEAEWEYACRAGTTDATWAGPIILEGANDAPVLDAIAWYGGNSGWHGFDLAEGFDSSDWPEKQYPHERAGTRVVRTRAPNPWGLHDMLGNVWEWCADADARGHEGADVSGRPRHSSKENEVRVIRGGSWLADARRVRAAYRLGGVPSSRNALLGFRCARGRAADGPGARSPVG